MNHTAHPQYWALETQRTKSLVRIVLHAIAIQRIPKKDLKAIGQRLNLPSSSDERKECFGFYSECGFEGDTLATIEIVVRDSDGYLFINSSKQILASEHGVAAMESFVLVLEVALQYSINRITFCCQDRQVHLYVKGKKKAMERNLDALAIYADYLRGRFREAQSELVFDLVISSVTEVEGVSSSCMKKARRNKELTLKNERSEGQEVIGEKTENIPETSIIIPDHQSVLVDDESLRDGNESQIASFIIPDLVLSNIDLYQTVVHDYLMDGNVWQITIPHQIFHYDHFGASIGSDEIEACHVSVYIRFLVERRCSDAQDMFGFLCPDRISLSYVGGSGSSQVCC